MWVTIGSPYIQGKERWKTLCEVWTEAALNPPSNRIEISWHNWFSFLIVPRCFFFFKGSLSFLILWCFVVTTGGCLVFPLWKMKSFLKALCQILALSARVDSRREHVGWPMGCALPGSRTAAWKTYLNSFCHRGNLSIALWPPCCQHWFFSLVSIL